MPARAFVGRGGHARALRQSAQQPISGREQAIGRDPKLMPRIIFFTIHNTTRWWKYLGSQIDFADVTVLSDLRRDGDWSLVDDFYRFMRSGDPAGAAAARFGEDGCAEIILRCRLLRS